MKVRTGLLLLLFCSVSVGLVASEPMCRVLVQHAATAVRHHSKETLARWEVWGKAHPNWRPRKRPPQNPDVASARLSCNPVLVKFQKDTNDILLPEQPIEFAEFDQPAPLETPVLAAEGTSPDTSTVQEAGLVPYNSPIYNGGFPIVTPPGGGGGGTSVGPPPPPPPTPPVPEPNYLVLLCGAFSAFVLAKRAGLKKA